MPDTATDPIRKGLIVPLPPAAAFELFTAGLDGWWPKASHSLSAATGDGDQARVRVEPRAGGRVIETRPDGTEAPWATVTLWEPGARFAMLWHVGRDPELATTVDVRFTAVDGGTRLDLTHSGFDVHGPRAGEMCANYTSGWDLVLGTRYAEACTRAAAAA